MLLHTSFRLRRLDVSALDRFCVYLSPLQALPAHLNGIFLLFFYTSSALALSEEATTHKLIISILLVAPGVTRAVSLSRPNASNLTTCTHEFTSSRPSGLTLQAHFKKVESHEKVQYFCHSFQKVKPIYSVGSLQIK